MPQRAASKAPKFIVAFIIPLVEVATIDLASDEVTQYLGELSAHASQELISFCAPSLSKHQQIMWGDISDLFGSSLLRFIVQ